MLVGRLAKEPEEVIFEENKKVINLTLAVSRGFKNTNGEIETDFFTIKVWGFILDSIIDNINVGNVVCVKGRIQTEIYEKDGENKKSTNIIAEKITFLSSSKEHTKENDDDLDM